MATNKSGKELFGTRCGWHEIRSLRRRAAADARARGQPWLYPNEINFGPLEQTRAL